MKTCLPLGLVINCEGFIILIDHCMNAISSYRAQSNSSPPASKCLLSLMRYKLSNFSFSSTSLRTNYSCFWRSAQSVSNFFKSQLSSLVWSPPFLSVWAFPLLRLRFSFFSLFLGPF